MTIEEREKVKTFYDSNDKPELSFESYYKYSFGFRGENGVMSVYVNYRGSSDDIYRFGVDNKPFAAPETFDALTENYNFAIVVNKATDEEFGYYLPC